MTSQLTSTHHEIKKLVGQTYIDGEDPYPHTFKASENFELYKLRYDAEF